MSECEPWLLVTIDWSLTRGGRLGYPWSGRHLLVQLCVPDTITIPDRNNFIANESEDRGPNYLSRFSVFNENSCGNSVSIKQVKEKQKHNIRRGLLSREGVVETIDRES